MATADGVKSKLQGLISSANAKTGGADTTLTAAVNTLIAGFGQGGGVQILHGSFTPAENTLTYTLTMPSPINNFMYCMNHVEYGFGVRLNIGGMKINEIDFPYMGLSTNAAGTSAAGMTDKGESISISLDGLSVTISENYVKNATYLVPREYVWIAW